MCGAQSGPQSPAKQSILKINEYDSVNSMLGKEENTRSLIEVCKLFNAHYYLEVQANPKTIVQNTRCYFYYLLEKQDNPMTKEI